jgi:hypothetical protein
MKKVHPVQAFQGISGIEEEEDAEDVSRREEEEEEEDETTTKRTVVAPATADEVNAEGEVEGIESPQDEFSRTGSKIFEGDAEDSAAAMVTRSSVQNLKRCCFTSRCQALSGLCQTSHGPTRCFHR